MLLYVNPTQVKTNTNVFLLLSEKKSFPYILSLAFTYCSSILTGEKSKFSRLNSRRFSYFHPRIFPLFLQLFLYFKTSMHNSLSNKTFPSIVRIQIHSRWFYFSSLWHIVNTMINPIFNFNFYIKFPFI